MAASLKSAYRKSIFVWCISFKKSTFPDEKTKNNPPFISEILNCKNQIWNVQRNVSSLRCFLPPASNSVSSASLRLLLSIDATTVPFDSFRYTENPTINSIQPAAAFVSGGNLLIFQVWIVRISSTRER